MGNPQLKQIDGIVYVDAKGYYEYPYYKKMEIANAIIEINASFRGKNKNILFIDIIIY